MIESYNTDSEVKTIFNQWGPQSLTLKGRLRAFSGDKNDIRWFKEPFRTCFLTKDFDLFFSSLLAFGVLFVMVY